MGSRLWLAGVVVATSCAGPSPVRPSRPPPPSRPSTAPVVTVADASPEVSLDASAEASLPLAPSNDPPVSVSLEPPGGPRLAIRQLGAALLELSVADSAPAKIELERSYTGSDGNVVTEHDTLEVRSGKRSARRVNTAVPGVTYTYRARAAQDWSGAVTFRVPVPSAPPPAPKDLKARAETPYAVRLKWQGELDGTSGFEVQAMTGAEFVRVALVDPTEHELVQHMLVPGDYLQYRVRAFNSVGVSDPSNVSAVTLPASVRGFQPKVAPVGRCIKGPLSPSPGGGCNPDVEEIDAGSGRVLFNAPDKSFACKRHFIGDYQGCRRDFGAFELQADVIVVPGETNEGWPLLHAIAGAGQYAGAMVLTLRFSKGRYSEVDRAFFCGDRPPDANDMIDGIEDADLGRSSPPFIGCQAAREP
jgi:hypothetical protein